MALSDDQRLKYGMWCEGSAWQILKREKWRYEFKGDTLVRFREYAPVGEVTSWMEGLLDFLLSDDSVAGFTVRGVTVPPLRLYNRSWTPADGFRIVGAWYETRDGNVDPDTHLERIRVYQAIRLDPSSGGGDGPYTVENGCRYKVDFTFHWNEESPPSNLPESSSGVNYRFESVGRDAETGLWSYILVKRTAVRQDVPIYKSSETLFETREEEQHIGVRQNDVASTGWAAGASEGVITERQITKNDDCTSDVRNIVTTEKAVSRAQVEGRRSLRATVTSVTDRNQPEAASVSNLSAGVSVRVERTPGKRYNNTVETSTPNVGDLLNRTCQDSAEMHTDTTVEVVPAGSVSEGLHQAAGVNVEREVAVQRNEDGVSADRRTTVRTWKRMEGFGSVDSGGTVVGTTERVVNADARPVVPDAPANTVIEADVQPNGHGGVNAAVKRTVYRERSTGSVSSGSSSVAVASESRINCLSVPSPGRGGPNVVKRVSATPNDHGSYTVNESVETHIPDSKTVMADSAGHTDVLTVMSNQTSPPSVGDSPDNVENDVNMALNDHGSLSVTTRRRMYKKKTFVAISGTPVERVETTVRTNDEADPTASCGSASVSPNGHGTATTSVAEVTPLPRDSGWITWDSVLELENGRYRYRHGLRVFKNLDRPPSPGDKGNVSMSLAINHFGLYDGSMSFKNLYRFERNTGGNASGIQQGNISFNGKTYPVKYFYGAGHEGEYAQAVANQVVVPGLHLQNGLVVVGAGV